MATPEELAHRPRPHRWVAAAPVVGLLAVGGVVLLTQRGLDHPDQAAQPLSHQLHHQVHHGRRPVPAAAPLTPRALAAATGVRGWRSRDASPPPRTAPLCTAAALEAALPYAGSRLQVSYAAPRGAFARHEGSAILTQLRFDSRRDAGQARRALAEVTTGTCHSAGLDRVRYADGTSVDAFSSLALGERGVSYGSGHGPVTEDAWVLTHGTGLALLESRNGLSSRSASVAARVADALVAADEDVPQVPQ